MGNEVWVAMDHNSGGAGIAGAFDSLELAIERMVKPGMTKVYSSENHCTWALNGHYVTIIRQEVQHATPPVVEPAAPMVVEVAAP